MGVVHNFYYEAVEVADKSQNDEDENAIPVTLERTLFPRIVTSWSVVKYSSSGDGTSPVYEIKSRENFPYAIIDERKMQALADVDYETAKETLGLDPWYNFNIEIADKHGNILLSYDRSGVYLRQGQQSSNFVTVLDQNNSQNGAGVGIPNKGRYVAQIFTCEMSGYLDAVELRVRAAEIKDVRDIVVDIRTVQNGKPSGDILASTTIPGFTDTAFEWKNATFDNPPELHTGEQYAIVIHPGLYEIYEFERNTDGYQNGTVETSVDGTVWTTYPSYDLLFKTWMRVQQQQNNNGNSNVIPHDYVSGDVVSIYTRDVLIRRAELTDNGIIYTFEPARLTIRIY